MTFIPDVAFDNPEHVGSAALEPVKQLWSILRDIGISAINVGGNPEAIEVLDLVFKMESYKGN